MGLISHLNQVMSSHNLQHLTKRNFPSKVYVLPGISPPFHLYNLIRPATFPVKVQISLVQPSWRVIDQPQALQLLHGAGRLETREEEGNEDEDETKSVGAASDAEVDDKEPPKKKPKTDDEDIETADTSSIASGLKAVDVTQNSLINEYKKSKKAKKKIVVPFRFN
jgi:hypothetical protein